MLRIVESNAIPRDKNFAHDFLTDEYDPEEEFRSFVIKRFIIHSLWYLMGRLLPKE